ncbi:hypothetical protein THAOC_03233, partial [Thalassiosira oceanica]
MPKKMRAPRSSAPALAVAAAAVLFVIAWPCEGASVSFLESIFTFANQPDGLGVEFDCPADKWCGLIVSQGLEPQVFTHGDTYVLARHSLCDWDCCTGLRDNAPPDHSCPHPTCCDWHGQPTGIRSFSSVMGDGWTWAADRGIGRDGGLRGPTCARSIDEEGSAAAAGFNRWDGGQRALIFAQASAGAVSFDGSTSLDVGYHGRGAFTACVVSNRSICGCGWPLGSNAHVDRCIDLDSNATYRAVADSESGGSLAHGALMSVALGLVIPIGGLAPPQQTKNE